MIAILFALLFNSYAFDLNLAEDVVFKPQYQGGKRYGTAFFISSEGHFLATNHGFEVCKDHDREANFIEEGMECPTYEGIYQGRSYSFSLIAYPSFNSTENLTLAKSFLRKDFLLGKIHLSPGEEVPFIDLSEMDPTYRYQQAKKIAGVTIEPFKPGIKKAILPGFSGAKLIVVTSKMIGRHFDKGYLLTISNNPELKGGSSGSPLFDIGGNFLGILVAKTDKVAVVLAKKKIIEGLSEIDPFVEEFLFSWD